LNRGLPGVWLRDQTRNAFQHDLNYRGFTASPIQETPQGIAVYQNGVRINEAWGDVVNWDFIPERAINSVSLYPSNPVFGLNAIGGALGIEMKNGFTYQGAELQTLMGSYGRAESSVQMGRQDGNLSAYAAFDNAYDKGFRDYTASHLNRMYVDVGTRNDQTEFHVNFTGADNVLGSEALTPVQVLNRNWSSAWVPPQGTHFQLAFLNSSLSHTFSDTLSFQGNAYYRGFWQSHLEANSTAAQACDPSLGATLCIGDAFTSFFQGVEAKLDWRLDRWNAYANYTFVDATYQSALLLSSPNNPFADANGNISVIPGDHIPGIPAHRFKVGAEYAVTDLWKVGADLNAVGSQYLIHDDANQNPKVPAYAVLNLHTSYQLTPNVELFGWSTTRLTSTIMRRSRSSTSAISLLLG
jgi:outer membrane cobalamin receptor